MIIRNRIINISPSLAAHDGPRYGDKPKPCGPFGSIMEASRRVGLPRQYVKAWVAKLTPEECAEIKRGISALK